MNRYHGGADSDFMRRAIELAGRGWGRVSPNPLVGAVVVKDDRIIGEGWHREYGLPHAEVEALRAAGEEARGATLYVTLEPCSHRGKTGPCTEATIAAGIARVVYAVADPNPQAGGGGEVLQRAGLQVSAGIEEERARSLLGPFLRRFAPENKRPWLELKLAVSLDGRIADQAGLSVWITGEEARAEVHRLRAGHDAIAIGIGTALADNPLLTARGEIAPRKPPVRIVFDRDLRLPPQSKLASTAVEIPVWVLAGEDPPPERRATLEALGVRILSAVSLYDGMEMLAREGIGSVFCEGGGTLASALLNEDLVDRLSLFYAPLFLGSNGRAAFPDLRSRDIAEADRWRLLSEQRFGEDTLMTLER
mgnify:CR=1 FL=1